MVERQGRVSEKVQVGFLPGDNSNPTPCKSFMLFSHLLYAISIAFTRWWTIKRAKTMQNECRCAWMKVHVCEEYVFMCIHVVNSYQCQYMNQYELTWFVREGRDLEHTPSSVINGPGVVQSSRQGVWLICDLDVWTAWAAWTESVLSWMFPKTPKNNELWCVVWLRGIQQWPLPQLFGFLSFQSRFQGNWFLWMDPKSETTSLFLHFFSLDFRFISFPLAGNKPLSSCFQQLNQLILNDFQWQPWHLRSELRLSLKQRIFFLRQMFLYVS